MTRERVEELLALRRAASDGPMRTALTVDTKTGEESIAVVTQAEVDRKGFNNPDIWTIANCGPNDEATKADALFIAAAFNELHALCQAALRGMVKVEWREIVDEDDIAEGQRARYGDLTVWAYRSHCHGNDEWIWALVFDTDTLLEGTAHSLEAAKTDCVEALQKLLRGEG